MKVLKKIIIFIGLMIVFLPSFSNAESLRIADASTDGSSSGEAYFLQKETEGFNAQKANDSLTVDLIDVIGRFLGVLRVLSGLILVVVIGTTGFNYVVSTPDVQSELKNRALPIILGLVFVFSATTIAKFIIGTFET